MGLTANSFTTTNTSFQEVTFIVTDGYIEITPKAVVVKSLVIMMLKRMMARNMK